MADKTYILGLSAYYHDSAAALVCDGKIVAAAQEERFTRKKHDARFPRNAVDYCLREAGIGTEDLTYVAFYDKPILKFERILQTYLGVAPKGLQQFWKAMPVWLKEKLGTNKLIRAELPGYTRRILFGEHHESHAASAFFPSPYEEAAVLTIDGVGEWATTTYGVGKGSELKLLGEINFPHSLGMLYSAFTYYTGFKVNSGEYKVMGLAPYGEPRFVDQILEHVFELREDGSFQMRMDHFDFLAGLRMTNSKFDAVFGGPPRQPETELGQREMDLAASVQVVTEMAMDKIARFVREKTGMKNLCLAGGVALNCVANGKLLRSKIFDNIWIQPAAGDAGGALGVALSVWHTYLQQPRTLREDGKDLQFGSYLGPAPDTAESKTYFDEIGAVYTEYSAEDLPEAVATALADEKVVGLCQGRMEFGPRALGGRSILGDARSSDMQTTMNLKIKFRESFRPFAPSILEEDVNEWFEQDTPSPYMLLVADVRDQHRIQMTEEQKKLFGIEKLKIPRSKIPAVTHVDYSARIQTVSEDTNPVYYKIIKSFKDKTGCPVVVNTSFNVRGEPIVANAEDAYRCFMRTNMDYLVVDRLVLAKTDQPAWKEEGDWRNEFELDSMSTKTPPKVGLSELNTSLSAPRHKDLFLDSGDPETAKKEKRGQARVLGVGFFVMFGVVITGLSFTFNGAWSPGYGVNFRSLSQEQFPGWQEGSEEQVHKAASLRWRSPPPALSVAGSNQGTPATSFDLAYDEQDDVEPAADQSPVRIYVDGRLVGTAYFPKAAFPSDAKTQALITLPNREPKPARKSFVHAYREAKLLRMLPTRYVLYVGCFLGLLGLLVPALLVPFYDFWMRYVTAPLGWFNTRLILTVLWFVIFTPMAIFRRLLSGDALRREQLPKDQTYWLEKKQRDHKHFQKGF